jgi:hypothetical protein
MVIINRNFYVLNFINYLFDVSLEKIIKFKDDDVLMTLNTGIYIWNNRNYLLED